MARGQIKRWRDKEVYEITNIFLSAAVRLWSKGMIQHIVFLLPQGQLHTGKPRLNLSLEFQT